MSFLTPKIPAMPPVPPIEPLPQSPDYEDEERRKQAAADAAKLRRNRIGRKQTILTSPLGDESEATVEKKTLLGG